ncbi:MAG TPA: potassium transporter TrkG [Myxococcota bacterium]|nr:potassium transporter TrkG [Myxococcota bacterium]HQK51774.1 potassium transporter TrkG [Myxococcota bacterium]
MRWFPYPGDLPDQLRRSALWTGLVTLVFLGIILTVEGLLLWDHPLAVIALYASAAASVALSLLHHALRLYQAVHRMRYLRRALPDGVLLVLMVWTAPSLTTFSILGTLRSLLWMVSLFRSTGLGQRTLDLLFRNPAIGTLVSFAGGIVGGGVLLALPRSTIDLRGLPWIDALFTATSALCVTGLSTINVSVAPGANPALPTLSSFGQVVLLLLIQAGGLGIMTLSLAAFQAIAGGALGIRGRSLAQDLVDEEGAVTTGTNLASILAMTLVFEGIGTLCLTLAFRQDLDLKWGEALWHGSFHAVSAFCNAGFSTFPTSLMEFLDAPEVLLPIAGLIILGGLGFPVFLALFARRNWQWQRHRPRLRLPLHARLAGRMTVLLLALGTVLLLLTDWDGAQAGLSVGERLWASFFQSVTARTAGFNVVDMARTTRTALVIYLLWMFIGTCPGGTGGGIKTTTTVVLLLSLRSMLRGQEAIEVMGRSLPFRTFQKAGVVTLLSFGVTTLVAGGLLWTQASLPGSHLVFEAVSAFGTVGLSLGATPLLDPWGKLLLVGLMYLGRVGPLTLVTALGQRPRAAVKFPEGRVLVG